MTGENVTYYIGGKFCKKKDSFISVNDIGLLRGYAVFEFLKTYKKKIFEVDSHLDRLYNSTVKVGLKLNLSRQELKSKLYDLIERNNDQLEDFLLKIVVTGGNIDSIHFPLQASNLYILVYPPKSYPHNYYRDGVSIFSTQYRREMPQVKTTNYLKAIMTFKNILPGQFQEVVFEKENNISEGATSNIFIIKGDTVFTPNRDAILSGITRNLVIKLCEKNDINLIEKKITYEELLKSDVVFITSTTRGIMPVKQVDDNKLKLDRNNSTLKKLQSVYRNYIKIKYDYDI